MSNSTSNNEPRKTLADFLSDNTANQILYNTVKQHTEIPDELILTAFIEAYAHCRDVIESPRLHTQRSETYTTMTDGIARSTLITLAFSYFLLSFHHEAPRLERYLSNLKTLLNKRLPDIFLPIYITARSTSFLATGTSAFGTPITIAFLPPVFENRQYVNIQHLIENAEKLPKDECLTVMKTLKVTSLEDQNLWAQYIEHRMEEIANKKEPTGPQSSYYIANRRISDFIVVMRVCAALRIFVDSQGFIITNFEKFAIALGSFFNTDLKAVSNTFSQAKDRKKFLKFFDKMKETAQKIIDEDDAPKPQQNQTSSKKEPPFQTELF